MKRKYAPIVGAMVALCVSMLQILDISISETEAETVTSALIILTGTLVALFGDPPKGNPNKTSIILMILFPAMILGTGVTQTGCAGLQDAVKKVDWGPTGKVLLETGIRGIAYAVTLNNPALAPVIMAATEALSPQGREPESFEQTVRGRFEALDLTPQEKQVLGPLVAELVRVYGEGYVAYGESPERDAELESLIDEVIAALQSGAQLGTTGEDASAPPSLNLGYSEVVLRIN